jgi:uncharacterized delta-60 repeat protein
MDLSVTSSPTGPQGMAWQHFSSGLWLRACLIFFVAWGLPASRAVAAPGDLDPTFGTDGKVVTNLGGTEAAYSVALQMDGKIVVAGISNANGSDDFMVTRYLEDGTLDASFGTGGTVLTDLSGAGSTDLGRRLAIQTDGKIVVVGETDAGTGGKNYALVRYMPDGTLDSSFGTGGLVVLDGGSSLNDGLSSIVIQPDGKLVVSGYFTHSVSGGSQLGVTLRFLANGAIDTSFASGGTSTIALPGKPHWSFDVALDASGRILVAGFGPQPSFLGYLTRLTANGSPDLSFNGGQVVTVEFSTGASSWCNTVNVQSDGRILVGGARWTQHSDFALERYLDNGTLDTSFGTAGVTTTDYAGNEEEVIDIAIDAHDRIITAGFQLDAADVELFGIHRYTRDGILDTTFGTGGRVLTTFGAVIDNSAYAVVLDVDGSIVAAGNAGNDIAVVRYEGGPTAPELVVTGNSTLITDSDITPSTADHTDFGSAQITSGSVTRTYTVQNSGDGTLTLGSVTITGTHAADFIVTAQPAASVAAGGSTTFQITFDPSAAGVRSATVNLTTNDGDESAFDFAIQGLGTGLPSPGQIIRPGNLSTGLKGWWKLEETTGTRMDSSGTGNHLTSNNVGSMVEDYWATGERSADFERDSGQFLSITHAAQSGLSLSGSFTLAAWVRPESIAGDGIMLGKWTPSTGYMLSYNASDGGTVNSFVDNNGNPKIYTDLVAGRWIHLVAVYDQAQNVISKYANGNLISVHSQATPPSQNSAEFRLGLRGDGADALDGLLKDVAVWDRPLSSLEVKSLASGIDVSTAYRPGNVSVAPTAWWKLDEIANGSTAVSRADSAAVSHPLTDNNTVQTGGGYLNGAAADFVAANSEYLTAPDSPDWTVGSGNASLSTWVRFRTLTGGSHYPIFSHSQDSMNYWMVYLYYTGGRHWLTLANAVSNVVTLELLADWQPKPGVWYHMAWTKSGTEHRFYVDGRPLGAPQTHATPLTDFAGPITIGRLPGTGVYLDGQQADVAFWKGYALSDAEIKALATALPVQKAGIVSYWPLDEASGTRKDEIGANHLSPSATIASAVGLVGSAADFEANAFRRLQINSAAQSGLNPVGALSVFGWVKPESTGSIQVIAARGYGNSGYGLSYRASGVGQFDTGPGAATTSSTVSVGTWSFLGGVWDGVRKLYFNGAIESNGEGTGPSASTHDFTIGANDIPGEYMDGLVDEVMVAGRWFRDEEVKALYLRGLNGLKAIISTDASLSSLSISSTGLSPAFASGTTSYTANVGFNISTVTLTPVVAQPNATVTVNGVPVNSGVASGAIPLNVGANTINTVVTAEDGVTTQTYIVTITRATIAAGDLIAGFSPNVAGTIYALAAQPDGKIIIGGSITSVGGVGRNKIARLNADGTLDTAFNPNVSAAIYSVVVQPDGKIIIGGNFVTVNGTTRNNIARLNADGTLDTGFNPDANNDVYAIAPLPGGGIVIGGNFTTVSGVTRNRLALLNADGTLDTGFNVDADQRVYGVGVQMDGKIVFGGQFITVGGVTRNRIARVNADGSLDTTFNPNAGGGNLTSLVLQPDGKWLVAGSFSSIGGTVRNNIARLNPDGTLDSGFNPNADLDVASLALQANGDILLCGSFTMVSGVARGKIARVNTSGVLDATFNPNANSTMQGVTLLPDGKILAHGSFTSFGGVPRTGLVMLHNDNFMLNLTPPDATHVIWSRSATAPELSQVTFDWSADGSTGWQMLGPASRIGISADWQLTGVSLLHSGFLRARGRSNGAWQNGSWGIVEHIQGYSGLPVPEITVEQPEATILLDNGPATDFGGVMPASPGMMKTFTIKNTGTADLTGLAVTKSGTHSADFALNTSGLSTTLTAGASTTFTVTFVPATLGNRSAALQIANNDADENPFDIALTGYGTGTQNFTYLNGSDVVLTTNGFTATGSTVNLSLGYAPAPFSVLTVVNNTSANPITGTFTNLAQGQTVTLSFGGTDYHFFADYFGGDGNDLVLVMKGPGVLDYTFGGTGKVWTEKLPGNDQARAVAVQPDGKVVAVGHDGGDFVVMRYNVDGTLDSGFGTGGRVTTAIGTETDEAHGVAIQGDGKIIVAGFAQTSGMRSMAVVRYLSNGTLDTTFDGDGKAVSLVGAFGGEGRDVVLQSDGKIVVGGDYWSGTDTDFALVRFNSDGSLDTSFGTGGIVTVAQPGRHDEAACVALAPDGKIVLAGHYQQGTDYVIELARFQTNGVLDTTFSGDGIQTTQIGAAERAHDVVVQPDGKIVLVGQGPGGGGNDGRVIRYKANGDLDETFSDDGHVGLSMGNWGDYAHSVALQWDGKILVAGITEDGVAANFMLARLLADGTLDTSFNGTGMVSTSLGATSSDFAYGMALGPDGHIVLAGLTTTGGTWDFVAARYLVETERDAHFATAQTVPMHAISFSGTGQTVNLTLGFQPTAGQVLTLVNNTGTSAIAAEFTNLANGQIIPLTYSGITYSFLASYTGGTGNDLTLTALSGALDYAFGASGKRVTGFGSGNDTIYAAAQQADGKIVVAGFSWNGSNDDLALARYDVNGTLDSSFGSGGKVVTGIGSGNDEVRGIAIQADGRIVAAGASHNGTNNDFVVARYNADGTLDTSFGGGAGFVTTAVGSSNDVAQGVVVQADGRIVVAGEAHNGTNNDFAVVRYNANGTLDTSFDSTGKVLTNVGGADDFGEDVALQPDGRIVVAGRSSNGANTDFAVVRYTTTGALDTTFNSSGMALIPVSTSDDEGRGVAIQADGKILVGGHSVNGAGGNDFALIRLTSGGTLDGGFASGGKLLTPMSAGEDYCLSVAFQADGRILAGGYAVSGGNADFALLRLLPTGALDNTWLGTGKVLTPVGGGNDEGRVVLALADGSALLAGRSHNGSNYDFAVARYAAEAEVQTHFTSAGTVALQSPLFSATGRTVNITLGFAPPLGTELLLLNNTGFHPISGEFANLAHGATVPLTFNSVNYGFVANYFGGDGNDLTLERAGTKLAAFGANESGQLGITGAATQANVPTQVVGTAPIYQKTILSMRAGQAHSLAVASDGTVAAWGSNANGQLGNGTTTSATTPVAVTMSGVLAGKKVIAVAAGGQHSLALCSDGTLAAWGDGSFGQIGDNGVLDRTSPVLVNTSGALSGKRVIAISAGANHSAALCSDGTVVCWGGNTNGELGNGNNTQSNVPVAVATSGVLLGHTAIAIACGQNHTLALLADGTVAAWGLNASGQLGNNSTTPSNVPALVSTAGVLNGKSVVEIAAGGQSALVRCSDGILAAWGLNDRGQLGVNSATTSFTTPQAVLTSGVLSGKTIVSLHMSQNHAGALCSDGSLAMWGAGNSGQLGNNAVSDSLAPVLANNAILGSTDLFIQTASGGTAGHTLALIGTAANEPKIVVEHEGGSLSHNSLPPVNFGSLVAGAYRTKGFVIRNAGTQTLAGISAATLGADAGMFVIQSQPQATLPPGEAAELVLRFNPQSIGGRTASLQITSNGVPSPFIVNLEGSGDPELNINWQTGREVPAQAAGFDANGYEAVLSLGFDPQPGARLMMLENTGLSFIEGIFTNTFYGVLVHGQLIDLNHAGKDYTFVVNYYGGDGNDLVLEWAGNRLVSWGLNSGGALGNGSSTPTFTMLPSAVSVTTPLSGKTILSAACGFNHSLALCSDGVVAAWGTNSAGQLGNNSTTSSSSPVAVNQTGVLSGRQVVAVAAGTNFSVALCSDGRIATWGSDADGQLGNDAAFSNSSVPVLVDDSGVLAGRMVTFIAAGGSHVLALCSDGTLVAWGSSSGIAGGGQLGNGSGAPFKSGVPVAVSTAGVLSGKTIARIAAGVTHSLAWCTDGTFAAWGENPYGMLGNGTNTSSSVPVVTTASGELAGRTPVLLGAGVHHSIMLGTDGLLSGWGRNVNAQLGVSTATTFYYSPINVPVTNAFGANVIEQLVPGRLHQLVCLSDGTIAAWGAGSTGQLGHGASPTSSVTPVYVSPGVLTAGERFARAYSGSSAQHNVALVAKPLTLPGGPPIVTTNAATSVDKTIATLNALVNPNSLATDARFEYGLTTSYGTQTALQTNIGSGGSDVTLTQALTGLQPNTTYHYRVIATNSGGSVQGNDLTFTTLPDPPVAVTTGSNSITNTSATLAGTVNPNTRATTIYFEFGTDTLYGNTTAPQNISAGSSNVNVIAPISGLTLGTTYHFRLVAQSAAGTAYGDDVVFTTTSISAPGLSLLTPDPITTTGATLKGNVNPNGAITTAWFEYGLTTTYTGITSVTGFGAVTSPQPVSLPVSSLTPATTYHYRLVAQNSAGTTQGADATFTTLPLPPIVETQAAAALSTTSARLHGQVNAQNGSAVVTFEWGTNGTDFPNALTAAQSPVTGNANTPVSVDITNLAQFTTYHFRVKATSSGGTTTGNVLTFQPAVISGLAQQFPNEPPASNGSLTVTLAPTGILSGWRFLGEHRWRASGDTVTGLVHGSRLIEFRPVPGYLQPGTDTVNVTASGQMADFEYYATPSSGTGGILVVLKPDTLAQAVNEAERGQWRLLGETTWRNSGTTVSALPAGSYLVECKPVSGYATPVLVNIAVSSGQTVNPAIVYADAFSPTGTPPSVLSFGTVSTDATKPYGYVGQIRSNSGLGTGFAVKSRVVATAAHVVFDEGSLSAVQGLQWLLQEDAGGHEPLPVTPRGYYLIDGYATQRAAETPGSFSLASRQKDVAALYFINDTDAARTGFAGFLASDLTNNEFLISNAQKMLVGYPVDGIAALDQGRMHATPAANLSFTGFAFPNDRVFATSGIRSTGGNSGGPLCVQHTNGNWYPAAIYLGGATQSIVRAIDSQVIQLFDTAQQSGIDDQGYTGGGITHSGYNGTTTTSVGAAIINITPAGSGWRPAGSTRSWTMSGNARVGLPAGELFVEFIPVSGYQVPANHSIFVVANSTETFSITFQSSQTPQETWRQTYFGTTANSGDAADSHDYDRDGFTNAQEYAAGTNPTLSGDFFKAENPQRSGNTFSVSTAGKTGRTYILERSATMTNGTWTTVDTEGPLAADLPVSLTDPSSPAGTAFYRIRVTGP